MASNLLYAAAGYAVVTVLALWLCWTRIVRPRRSPDRKPAVKPKTKVLDPVTQPTPQPPATQASKQGVSLKALQKQAHKRGSKPTAEQQEQGPDHALLLNILRGHTDSLMGMSFSRDGAAITTVSADRTVRTFSLAVLTDRRITSTHRTLREDPVDVAHGESAADLVILSTGIGEEHHLRMYHTHAGDKKALDEAWHLPALSNEPALCLKSAGGIVVAASAKQQLVVTDLAGRVLATLNTAGLVTHDIGLSQDGRWIAAATFSSDVKVYEVHRDRAGAVTQIAKSNLSLKGHSGQVTAVAFAPDGTRAVTASKDGLLIVWNLAVRYQLNEDAKQLLKATQEVEHGTSMTHLAFGPGKKGVLVGAAGSTLLFMSSSGQVLERVEGAHRGGISSLELCPQLCSVAGVRTAVVASTGRDNAVRLWRLPQD